MASFFSEDLSTAKHREAKQRFLEEYPKAFERLSSPFRNFLAKGHVKEEIADIPKNAQGKAPYDNDQVPWENVAKIAKDKLNADFTFYFEGESVQFELCYAANMVDSFHPSKRVRCTTPSYYFVLEKQTGSKEYVIVQHTAEKEFVKKAHVITDVQAKFYAEAAFNMYGTPGNLLLSEKDCKIDSIRYVDAENENMVAVEFTGLSKDFWYKRGRAVFDSSRNWALTEYELHEEFPDPYGRTMLCKVEYGDWNSNQLVFPKKVDRQEVYTTSGKATQLRHEVATFTVANPDVVPKGQFSLSAYGLPDIPPTGQPSSLNNSLSGLVLDMSSNDIGQVLPEEKRAVRFLFHNRTAKPIRIIGAEQTCGPDGCNEFLGLPVEIAPQSDAEVEVSFTPPSREGDFSKQFTVFSDCSDRPHIDLTIRGTVRK
jgi:hypothetical protein